MKRLVLAALVLAAIASTPCLAQSMPKSVLDGMQFDGVSSDAELKIEHHNRRQWLDAHPVQAKEYWKAWDCKGRPCDSKWQATIRAEAALIPRSAKDPKPPAGGPVTSD